MIGGDQTHPARAQMFIPCLINQCMTDGRRSRMQLILWREDGALLERPYNDGPYYRCEREGCYYRDHPRGLHEISSEWIRSADVQDTMKDASMERRHSEVLI